MGARFDMEEHLASLDAELTGAFIPERAFSRHVGKAESALELMTSVVSALHFFSKHCAETPGLDFLVGVRGTTAEIRAERQQVPAILWFEQDGPSALRIEERRFGAHERRSSSWSSSSDEAVQHCVEFVARHIARIRPDLARETGKHHRSASDLSEAGLPVSYERDGARRLERNSNAWAFDRRSPRGS
jgi:hypothetical protein